MATENPNQFFERLRRANAGGGFYTNTDTGAVVWADAVLNGTIANSFTYYWYGTPVNGSFCNVGNPGGGRTGFRMSLGVLYWYRDNAATAVSTSLIPFMSFTDPTAYSITLDRIAQTLTYMVGDSVVATASWLGNGEYLIRNDGWVDAFSGYVSKRALITMPMIRSAMFQGGSGDSQTYLHSLTQGRIPKIAAHTSLQSPQLPAGLVIEANQSAWVTQPSNGRLVKAAGQVTGPQSTYVKITNALPSTIIDAVYRFSCDVTLNSGNASDLPMVVLGDYGTLTNVYGRLQPGRNEFLVDLTRAASTIDPAGDQRITFNYGDTYGGTAGATDFTVTNALLERCGTRMHHAPDSLTPSGFWHDVSGWYNFAPVPVKPSLSPVNPKPQTITIPASRPSVTVPAFFGGTATVAMSSSNPVLAQVQPGDLAVASLDYSSATNGFIEVSPLVVTGTGTIIQRLMFSGGPDTASDTLLGYLTITKY